MADTTTLGVDRSSPKNVQPPTRNTSPTDNGAADRLRGVLDHAADPMPPAWLAAPGDELVGHFEEWREGRTRRNERHRVAIVRDIETNENVAVWMFYKVLRQELEQADPQRGELLAIRRLDDRTGAHGDYRVFRVVVDREGGAT